MQQDYFALFALTPEYGIDLKELHRRFLALQHALHPDNFVGKDPAMKKASALRSAHINDAYQTLIDPVKRARYLLLQNGVQLDETTVHQRAMLQEQMTFFESIDAAKRTDNTDALQTIYKQLHTKTAEKETAFAHAYRKKDFAAATDAVRYLQFYTRLIERTRVVLPDAA